MISQTIQNALNSHIVAEHYSSYLYLAMSAWCETHNFKGFSRWLRIQASEERDHGLKMMDYLMERGGRVELKPIDAPPAEFSGVQNVFDAVLTHERHVTELIHRLYEAARSEKDHATELFLQWFVTEQVEEEANASEIADKIRMVGEKGGGVLYLDKEYGKRGG